jgi:hypothetical protein
LPPNWLGVLETGLASTGHVAVVYDHDGARIFRIVPNAKETAP